MDIRILVAKTLRRIREAGVMATLRGGFRHFTRAHVVDDFDRIHGTDTGNFEPLWNLKIRSPNVRFGNNYQATDEQELVDALQLIHDDPRTLTFIDIGCGKGRPLLVASKIGFEKIIGVEFARELTDIARANLIKMGVVNAAVEYGDAADFRFPDGDVLLYLYNPFSEQVLRRVLDHLRESHAQRLYVVYKAPVCAELFDSSGFLTRLGSPPGRPNIQVWQGVH